MELRRGLALFVLALTWWVAGCAEGEPTAQEPVTSASSAPVNAAAEAPEEETAEEFIRRWFAVQVEMQNTGDATEFLAMAPRCVDCRASAEYIKTIFDAGGTVDYGGEKIRSIKRYRKSGRTYGVVLSVQPTSYRENAGASLKTMRGGRAEFDVTLAKKAERWEVTELVMVVR